SLRTATGLNLVTLSSAVSTAEPDLRTSFRTLVSVFIIIRQHHAVFFSHARMSVALRCLGAAFVSLARFVALTKPFVRAGQHTKSISLVVELFEITFQRVDQILIAARLLILFREPEKHTRVAGIRRQHLFE